jgi:hypothetical protein
MRRFKYILSSAFAVTLFCILPVPAKAQVSIGVQVGAAPACPYGYYGYAPYNCAPDGYYGPTWFNGGAFVGAGPWFHGPAAFHGKVNNHYDPQHGYHGALPQRGQHADHAMNFKGFKGNEVRDGRGHVRK